MMMMMMLNRLVVVVVFCLAAIVSRRSLATPIHHGVNTDTDCRQIDNQAFGNTDLSELRGEWYDILRTDLVFGRKNTWINGFASVTIDSNTSRAYITYSGIDLNNTCQVAEPVRLANGPGGGEGGEAGVAVQLLSDLGDDMKLIAFCYNYSASNRARCLPNAVDIFVWSRNPPTTTTNNETTARRSKSAIAMLRTYCIVANGNTSISAATIVSLDPSRPSRCETASSSQQQQQQPDEQLLIADINLDESMLDSLTRILDQEAAQSLEFSPASTTTTTTTTITTTETTTIQADDFEFDFVTLTSSRSSISTAHPMAFHVHELDDSDDALTSGELLEIAQAHEPLQLDIIGDGGGDESSGDTAAELAIELTTGVIANLSHRLSADSAAQVASTTSSTTTTTTTTIDPRAFMLKEAESAKNTIRLVQSKVADTTSEPELNEESTDDDGDDDERLDTTEEDDIEFREKETESDDDDMSTTSEALVIQQTSDADDDESTVEFEMYDETTTLPPPPTTTTSNPCAEPNCPAQIECKYGRQKDPNSSFGCDTCDCNRAPNNNSDNTTNTAAEYVECTNDFLCTDPCLYGSYTDEYGCESCTCKPRPMVSPDGDDEPCPKLPCPSCDFGSIKDEHDCHTCLCIRPNNDEKNSLDHHNHHHHQRHGSSATPSCSSSAELLACPYGPCKHGSMLNEHGCATCDCLKASMADDDDGDDNDNVDVCGAKMSRRCALTSCPHGFFTDADGCETCMCKPAWMAPCADAPKLACDLAAKCGRHGSFLDRNGCPTCECLPNPDYKISCDEMKTVNNHSECNPDGTYKHKQCNHEECRCVTKDGLPIGEFRADLNQSATMNCECAVTLYEVSMYKALGFKIFCSPNGNYETIQCVGGSCACVNEHGEPIGPSVPIYQRHLLRCEGVFQRVYFDKLKTTRAPVTREQPLCLFHREKALEMSESEAHLSVPECDRQTGLYEPVQCDRQNKYCWCVNKHNGVELSGTRKTNGQRPECSL